jgi:hypothetical protein
LANIHPADKCQRYNHILHINPGGAMRNKKFLILLLAVGAFTLVMAAAWFFTYKNASLPTPVPPTQTGTARATPPPPVSGGLHVSAYPEIARVPLVQAKAALDARSAVFIDVRSTASYAGSHIPGALSFPLTDIESLLGELDPNQWIITYCT